MEVCLLNIWEMIKYVVHISRLAVFKDAWVSGDDPESCLDFSQAFVKENGEPKVTSGKQEKYESIFNRYIWRIVRLCGCWPEGGMIECWPQPHAALL